MIEGTVNCVLAAAKLTHGVYEQQEGAMLKCLIVGSVSFAFVSSAIAADLPRPQPVVQNAPIGKYPVGKYPVGKTPVGKYPAAPVVTRG